MPNIIKNMIGESKTGTIFFEEKEVITHELTSDLRSFLEGKNVYFQNDLMPREIKVDGDSIAELCAGIGFSLTYVPSDDEFDYVGIFQ